MAYAVVADVKSFAIFKDEIATKTDAEIERLIKRASMMLENEVGTTFRNSTDEDILFKLNTATIYLVDRLYFIETPEIAETALSNLASEDAMNTSYSVSNNKTQLLVEFEKEYALIVAGLQAVNTVAGWNIFTIGHGASSFPRRGDDQCD